MLLKANKYRKDKKADCRQNKLGSRIFMGKVFGDYAECLHFYPSFSYGRIIAGETGGSGGEEAPCAAGGEKPRDCASAKIFCICSGSCSIAPMACSKENSLMPVR